ncbi:MAG TPA: DUF2752 domain-containing protein [Candidatus Polarisedimenticolia bacterium]|nr:DUF2752 domain-containing protein [Candidatus Polarisedimenticolia bacterium]
MEAPARAPGAAAPIPILPILGVSTLLAAVAARLHLLSLAGGIHLPLFCPFRQITGWPCPTCGSTRALAALTQGRLIEALSFNPLVAAVALFLVAAAMVSLACRSLHVELPAPPRPGPALSRLLRAGALGLILVNWSFLILRS